MKDGLVDVGRDFSASARHGCKVEEHNESAHARRNIGPKKAAQVLNPVATGFTVSGVWCRCAGFKCSLTRSCHIRLIVKGRWSCQVAVDDLGCPVCLYSADKELYHGQSAIDWLMVPRQLCATSRQVWPPGHVRYRMWPVKVIHHGASQFVFAVTKEARNTLVASRSVASREASRAIGRRPSDGSVLSAKVTSVCNITTGT